MAVSLDELARKGYDNYSRKRPAMVKSYSAARDRMAAGYDATPFGPTRKGNYRAALDSMIAHYTVERLDADKWKRNWMKKMSE
jgi:hypothetical protein